MNTSVQIFNFNQNNVRVQIINDEPFFCLKDVAEILEIKDTKAKNFRLSEKGVEISPLLTNGGVQQMTFINEPNLYRVIFRSRKAEAVQFQDWIFEEVIPAIRKTGSYQVSDGLPAKTTAAANCSAIRMRCSWLRCAHFASSDGEILFFSYNLRISRFNKCRFSWATAMAAMVR